MNTPLPRVLAALAPMLAVLVGCGDAEDEQPVVTAPAPVRPGASSVRGLVPGGRAARGNQAPAPGNWHRAPARGSALTEAQRKEIERLRALGYARGSSAPTGANDVTVYDPECASDGFNLYVSGHGPEAFLIDMDGRTMHSWRCEYARAWPERAGSRESRQRSAQHWRRVHLFPDGALLAIFAGIGMIKLDKDSNLLWTSDVGEHHDLDVMPDGDIYVLTRTAHIVPRVNAHVPVLEDFISILDANGEEKSRISLLECLENSRFRSVWNKSTNNRGWFFHTNTLTVLDGRLADRLPEFRKGNVLTSMRGLDTIAVVDLERRKVVWAKKGPFRGQHDPQVLDNGNLLLFDNYGLGRWSRVMELDPVTEEIGWRYRGTREHPFYSKFNGTTARLPNGNTLIVESNKGRAFEVTPEKETVWEFLNPHRAGDDDEFVATLFDLMRLPADFSVGWADR